MGDNSTSDSLRTTSDDAPVSKKLKLDGSCEHHEYTSRCIEPDVGITEYISCQKGIHGIIKQRYSDFIVNEINLAGKEIHLTSTQLPPDDQEIQKESDEPPFDKVYLEKLSILAQSSNKKDQVLIPAPDDKGLRTKVHQFIKQHFTGIETNTVDEDGKRYIKAAKQSGNRRTREVWPSNRPDYLHFILYKENIATAEALNIIAKKVAIKPGAFQYAGTKDKRAKTSQQVSVLRLSAQKLARVQSQLRRITVGNFRYASEQLKLGDLSGNRFSIVLRQIHADEEVIDSAMKSLKDKGFINYYGMQRFGTREVPTHHIGRALLKSRWEEAVRLIMKPRDGEDATRTILRRVWAETGDAKQALAEAGTAGFSIEAQLLRGLTRCKHGDWVGALTSVARNSRLLYIHAYQSCIWNTIVSRRIRKFGLTPLVGDLVYSGDLSYLETGDHIYKQKPEVKRLTERDLATATIEDVIMPLVGYDVLYPENEVGEWYKQMLEDDDLSSEKLRNRVTDYALPGAYRAMIIKPQNVTWKITNYTDPNIALTNSDLDEMNKPGLEEKLQRADADTKSPEANSDVVASSDVKNDSQPNTSETESTPQETSENSDRAQQRALIINLSLSSSCYATMALREILKADTSSHAQAAAALEDSSAAPHQ